MSHQDNLNDLINKYKNKNDAINDVNDANDEEDEEQAQILNIEDNNEFNKIMEDLERITPTISPEEKKERHKLKLKIRRYQRTFKAIPDIQHYDLDSMDVDELKYTISEIQLTVQNYNINEIGKNFIIGGIEIAELGLNIFDIDCSGTSDSLKNSPQFLSNLDEIMCEMDITYFPAYKRLLISIIMAFRAQYKFNKMNNKPIDKKDIVKDTVNNEVSDKVNDKLNDIKKIKINNDIKEKYSRL